MNTRTKKVQEKTFLLNALRKSRQQTKRIQKPLTAKDTDENADAVQTRLLN